MSNRPFTIFVVRPYHPQIRKKVTELLHSVNGTIPEGWVSIERATDKEVIKNLSLIKPDLLLIPFHAHKDAQGAAINGINTLLELQKAYGWCKEIPVVMPVSRYAKTGFQLAKNELADTSAMSHVFTINEESFASASLHAELKIFLQQHQL